MADRPDRPSTRRRSSDVPRLDQPQEFRRRFVPTPSFSQETFGALSEGFARWMGTAQFLFGMTVFVTIWLAWNTVRRPFGSVRPPRDELHPAHPDPVTAGVLRRPAHPARAEPSGRPRPRRAGAGPRPRRAQPRRHGVPHPRGRRIANRLTRHGNSRLRPLRAAPAARRDGGAWHDLSATGLRRRRTALIRGGRTFTSGYGHFPVAGYRMAPLTSDSNDGVRTGLHV